MSARSTSGRTGRSKYWKQAPDIVARPRETPGIPNHVHWYEFLGPAPDRPYHPVYTPAQLRVVVGLRHRVRGQPAAGQAERGTRGGSGDDGIDVQPALAVRPLPRGVSAFGESGSLFIGSKGKLYSPSDYGSKHGFSGPRPSTRISRHLGARPCPGSRVGMMRTRIRRENGSRPSARASRQSPCRTSSTHPRSPNRCFSWGNVAVLARARLIRLRAATGRITNRSPNNGIAVSESPISGRVGRSGRDPDPYSGKGGDLAGTIESYRSRRGLARMFPNDCFERRPQYVMILLDCSSSEDLRQVAAVNDEGAPVM